MMNNSTTNESETSCDNITITVANDEDEDGPAPTRLLTLMTTQQSSSYQTSNHCNGHVREESNNILLQQQQQQKQQEIQQGYQNQNQNQNLNQHQQYQFACLYTKQKIQKKKIWKDGRLVIHSYYVELFPSDKEIMGITEDTVLDRCELSHGDITSIIQGFKYQSTIETELFLITIEGPYIQPTRNANANANANTVTTSMNNKNNNTSSLSTTMTTTSLSMKKILSNKFRKPPSVIPPPISFQQQQQNNNNGFLGKRRRPIQPGELVRQYYPSHTSTNTISSQMNINTSMNNGATNTGRMAIQQHQYGNVASQPPPPPHRNYLLPVPNSEYQPGRQQNNPFGRTDNYGSEHQSLAGNSSQNINMSSYNTNQFNRTIPTSMSSAPSPLLSNATTESSTYQFRQSQEQQQQQQRHQQSQHNLDGKENSYRSNDINNPPIRKTFSSGIDHHTVNPLSTTTATTSQRTQQQGNHKGSVNKNHWLPNSFNPSSYYDEEEEDDDSDDDKIKTNAPQSFNTVSADDDTYPTPFDITIERQRNSTNNRLYNNDAVPVSSRDMNTNISSLSVRSQNKNCDMCSNDNKSNTTVADVQPTNSIGTTGGTVVTGAGGKLSTEQLLNLFSFPHPTSTNEDSTVTSTCTVETSMVMTDATTTVNSSCVNNDFFTLPDSNDSVSSSSSDEE